MVNRFIRENMSESEYRPEQRFTRDYLAKKYRYFEIKSEFSVSNLKIDGKPTRSCILDLAIPEEKMAIRLNGGYHFSSDRQVNKDEFQKIALEQAGWYVIDLNHYMMPNLFNKKTDEETVKLAEKELDIEFGKHTKM